MRTGILLLAYGSPESLNDIPEFLSRIRGGAPVPDDMVAETIERYRLIGGSSPLHAIVRSVASKLESRMEMSVYAGMRHSPPFIEDVVKQMVDDGVRRIIAVCMTPQYSKLSVGAYKARVDQAVCGAGVEVEFVESWHMQPEYVDGVTSNVRAAIDRFPASERGDVKVLFTAHTLPASIRDDGDPYESQLHETACVLARRLDLKDGQWIVCYQSAPRRGGPWLEPQVESVVSELAEKGERNLVVAPIGFVTDHLEVLYDIDIRLQEIARKNGMRLERAAMLNDSDALVNALSAACSDKTIRGANTRICP